MPHSFSKAKQYFILFFVLLATPITGATIDIYTPSIPSIMHYFHSSATLTQLTVTAYLFGYGGTQLIAGSLSDMFGRKKVLIVYLVLFIIVSALAPYSSSVGMLLFLRFLQGVFVSGPGVVNKTLVTDIFSAEQSIKYANYITIAWALGPIIAPVIGGYLQVYVGWHAAFFVLAGYGGLLLLLSLIWLPETHFDRKAICFKSILKHYALVFNSRVFIGGVLCLSLTYSFITVFNVMGPFLVEKVMHYSPIVFGHIALYMGLAWLIGNVSNRVLVNKLHVHHIISVSTWLLVLTAILMFVGLFIYGTNLWTVAVPTFFLLMFGGVIFPNCFGKCITLFAAVAAGSASAIMGSLFVIGAGASTVVASFLESNSVMPMAWMYLAIAILCLLSFYLLFRKGVLSLSKSKSS